VAVEKQHVDRLDLVDVAVSLKLLAHLGAERRDGQVQRVHGLDLGSLSCVVSIACAAALRMRPLPPPPLHLNFCVPPLPRVPLAPDFAGPAVIYIHMRGSDIPTAPSRGSCG
jgi:hypothetical protein